MIFRMATSRVLAIAIIMTTMVCILADIESSDAFDVQCKNLSSELATALSSFDQCAMEHARPFKMCRSCASLYGDARRLFTDVIHVSRLQLYMIPVLEAGIL